MRINNQRLPDSQVKQPVAQASEQVSEPTPTQVINSRQSPREAFTLIDPNMFCVEGAPDQNDIARFSKHTALGLSGVARLATYSSGVALKTVGRVLGPVSAGASAALTTANMRNTEKAQADRQARITAAAAAFQTERGVDWQAVIPDLVAADNFDRNTVAEKVGMAGDYIAAGSAFLLTFPPAAAAGFAAGLAVRAGGEIGKHIERRAIKNIYDLLAQAVVKDLKPSDIEKLWFLLETRGISPDANYRLEVWAFCRAVEKHLAKAPSPASENLLSWLEEKLLKNIDERTDDVGFEAQVARELGPTLAAGQVTVSWADAPRDSIQRLQTPPHAAQTFSSLLPARLEQALNRVIQRATPKPDEHKALENKKGHNIKADARDQTAVTQAVRRAIIATLGDFDAASMMAAKIGYRLYVDNTGQNEAIACSDMHEYHDCHFILSARKIDMIRCGIFRVRSADDSAETAYIPYLRKVSVPIDSEAERIQEHFDLLSDRWYGTPTAAARQLPSKGIPPPLMDWHLADQNTIESQLNVVATQLERTDFQALAAGQDAMPLALALKDNDKEGASPCRHFVASGTGTSANRISKNRRGKQQDLPPLSRGALTSKQEEIMVAVARLLAATADKTAEVSSSSRAKVTPARLEAMLGVRQQLLRGLKDWLHHTPVSQASLQASKGDARAAWRRECHLSLEHAVTQLETQIITLTEQRLAAGLM